MSFGDAERKRKKQEKPEWTIKAVLGEIQKNKIDVLKITRVEFAGKDLINFQVWRTNTETDTTFPLKDNKVSFNIELKDQVIEALEIA